MTGAAKIRSMRGPILWGFATIAVLVGGLGLWSVVTTLSGAVIASGQVEVSQYRQVVQHPDGGVIADILVADGDMVEAGQVLLRLDGSSLKSEHAILENQIFELSARRARLEAERDDADAITNPTALLQAASTREDVADIVEGQAGLFAAHREALELTISQRKKRIQQVESQVRGLLAQEDAVKTQIALLEAERATQQGLLLNGLTQAAQVSAIDRDLAQAKGRAGEITAALAEAAGKITEIEIEIFGLSGQRSEKAEAELRDIVARELELTERLRELAERIDRLDIKAPASGIVLGLKVTTPQAVVRPADPLMHIVPQDRPLLAAVRVPLIHIDEIHVGQDVRLLFVALPSRLAPELTGRVSLISADALQDDRTGAAFYRVEIEMDLSGIKDLTEASILPGMPVDAFIQTEDRTPLAYFLKPFTDYFRYAFRET